MLLADIGNTHFHIYDGNSVEHLLYDDAIEKYSSSELLYISVKHQLSEVISDIKSWKNVSSQLHIEGEYETMGVDRKALCLSHKDGLFVDAGSAITVDLVEDGVYRGGFIYPGLSVMLKCYESISPALSTKLEDKVDLAELPLTTKEQISYGIIAPIKALINQHIKDKTLYITGGDGKLLSTFFENAIYDEKLVFKGMQNSIASGEGK